MLPSDDRTTPRALTAALAWTLAGCAALGASTVPYYEPTVADGEAEQNYPFPDRAATWRDNDAIRPDWRIPEQTLPSKDVPVVGYSVKEFGAKGDGETDDTHAFHEALNRMAAAGGGTVWVPAGEYVIRGTLDIPINVELRGEWRPPKDGRPAGGTILMAYAGRGDPDGEPFIETHSNSAVTHLSIWYPEQSASDPEPYPWTIYERPTNLFKPFSVVQNVTLYNSWKGIYFGASRKGHVNWYVRRVYGTPLKQGVDLDMNNDTGRIYDVSFAPRYWRESGLPGAPEAGDGFADWLRSNGTAFTLRRQDFAHWGPFSARGYHIGVHGTFSLLDQEVERMATYGRSHFQGHLYGVRATDCEIAAKLEGLHEAGVAFTDCTLEGREAAVVIPETEQYPIQFNGCRLAGPAAIRNRGASTLGLLHSEVEGPIHHAGRALSLAGGSYRGRDTGGPGRVRLDASAGPVTLAGAAARDGALRLEGADEVHRSAEALPASTLPELSLDTRPPAWRRPAEEELFVATADRFGAPNDNAKDATRAIQSALDAAGEAGGGVVFVPPGFYRLDGRLDVPSGVELRGPLTTPHHVARAPAVLLVGRRDAGAPATLTANARAGVRGLGFFYPWQDWQAPEAQPFLLQGRGKRVYFESLTAGATSRLLDLASHRADRHWVDALSANVLKEGIAVGGGSRGGRVLNSHFVSHFWSLLNAAWEDAALERYWGARPERLPVMKWEDKERGEAFIDTLVGRVDGYRLGAVRDQTLFHNFIYGCQAGLVAERGAKGRAPEARVFHHGSDASIAGARLEAAGPRGLHLVNLLSYNLDGETARGLEVALDAKSGGVFAESFQTTGWSGAVFEHVSGELRINGGLFLDTAKRGFRVGDGPVSLIGGYFNMPAELFEMAPDAIAGTARASIFAVPPWPGEGVDAAEARSVLNAAGDIVLDRKRE